MSDICTKVHVCKTNIVIIQVTMSDIYILRVVIVLPPDSKENEKDKKKKEGLGLFYNLPQYTKLYEVLRGAYSNYKVRFTFKLNK